MRRKSFIRVLLATALPAGMLAGCANGQPVPGPTEHGVFVQAANPLTIPVEPAQLAQAERGSEAFGLALLRKLGANGSSMVYSPQTLVDLLGMLLPGAQGATRTALADALGLSGLDADTGAAALGRVDATARSDANQGSNTLDEASDVWAADGLTLQQGYLAALGGAFHTGVHQTDFQHDPANAEDAEDAVNALVSEETHGYIKQLFSKGSIDASTLLVLTDAVYLNANWAQAFDPDKTSDAPFYTDAGSPQQTSMMDNQDTYKYASGNGWQAVELPYTGGKLTMDVLLPSKGSGTLAALRNSLTLDSLNAMLAALTPERVDVQLPKFTTDSTAEGLKQDLAALGLSDLFSHADLSGMFSGGAQAYVSQVVEKAHIAVGEKGTVAAAAAGGAVGATAVQAVPLAFTADHPFLYLVRDLTTGQLLFAGQLTAPSA